MSADRKPDREPSPGEPQEKVEDRPSVSIVTPEDYPEKDRAESEAAPRSK